jgi:hypothetical protein
MSEEENTGSGTDGADVFGESLESVKQEIFPAADAGAEPECEQTSDRDEAGPAPLASVEAPWVGAEQKWLEGEGDVPAEPAAPPGREEPASSSPLSAIDDDDAILAPGQIPVLPSLLPPSSSGSSVGFEIGIAVALLVVVAVAAGIVYWMNESFAEREREILALRASDRQEVIRLEREIRELLARGGTENEARANELRLELQARQEAASRAAAHRVEEEREEGDEERDGERERRRSRDTEGGKDTVAAKAEDEPVRLADYPDDETAQPGKAAGGPGASSRDEDDLLASAFAKPAAATAAAPIQGTAEFPLGATELPAKPSREQVQASMDAVASAVARCGPGSGRIVISVSVAGATGRVVSAEPAGEAAGTTIGLCAARAARLAKFPRFGQERLQIKYPFDL